MKKIITALFCTAFALSMTMTAYAAEALDRDYIEAEIWEDIWNGNTVDSFPPFSTLEDEEDESESTDSYEIQDDGEESPRVIGEVTGEATSGPDSAEVTEESSTPDSTKTEKGVNPVPITVGATLVGGVGVAGYLVNKKRRK